MGPHKNTIEQYFIRQLISQDISPIRKKLI